MLLVVKFYLCSFPPNRRPIEVYKMCV